MTIELTEAERSILRAELKKNISVYDSIMEATPSGKVADLCNVLSDIVDKLEPPIGVQDGK